MNRTQTGSTTPRDRRTWEPPQLKTVGTVAEILQSGGGKPSVSTADPGEPCKTKDKTGTEV